MLFAAEFPSPNTIMLYIGAVGTGIATAYAAYRMAKTKADVSAIKALDAAQKDSFARKIALLEDQAKLTAEKLAVVLQRLKLAEEKAAEAEEEIARLKQELTAANERADRNERAANETRIYNAESLEAVLGNYTALIAATKKEKTVDPLARPERPAL